MIEAGDIVSPFKEEYLQKQYNATVRATGTFPDMNWEKQRHLLLEWNNPSIMFTHGWYPDGDKWIKIGEDPDHIRWETIHGKKV